MTIYADALPRVFESACPKSKCVNGQTTTLDLGSAAFFERYHAIPKPGLKDAPANAPGSFVPSCSFQLVPV